jgi:hypothetical protein
MKRFFNNIKNKLSLLLSPEPEIKEDYVDKVVFLLRRDFNSQEQNEIILAIGEKISKLRAEDMRRMEENYQNLQKNTNILAQKMAIEL